MRIPIGSNFSRELSKKFEKIFNREMYLDDIKLKDLQEHIDSLPVDTHLQKQVSKLKGNKHEPKKNVSNARAVRQEYTQRESIAGTVAKSETKKKEVGLAVTSS